MQEKMTLGPTQDAIIKALARPRPVSIITAHVYGLKPGQIPTRSQKETVRQALRVLERHGAVRLTKFLYLRERSWELTGTIVEMPPKKAEGLKVVK